MALRWVTALVLTALAASECPSSSWIETSDGYCYYPLPDPTFAMTSPNSAVLECEAIEATASLPEIYNERDQIMIDELTPLNSWLGLRRDSLDEPFYWPSGHAVTFTKWQPTQPYNSTGANCVGLDSRDDAAHDGWFTYPCDSGAALAICYTKAT